MLRNVMVSLVLALLVSVVCPVSLWAEDAAVAASFDTVAREKLHDNLRKKLGNNDDLRSLCSGLKICLNVDF